MVSKCNKCMEFDTFMFGYCEKCYNSVMSCINCGPAHKSTAVSNSNYGCAINDLERCKKCKLAKCQT